MITGVWRAAGSGLITTVAGAAKAAKLFSEGDFW